MTDALDSLPPDIAELIDNVAHRRRGRAAARREPARALPRDPADAPHVVLRRRAARPDHDLPRPARARTTATIPSCSAPRSSGPCSTRSPTTSGSATSGSSRSTATSAPTVDLPAFVVCPACRGALDASSPARAAAARSARTTGSRACSTRRARHRREAARARRVAGARAGAGLVRGRRPDRRRAPVPEPRPRLGGPRLGGDRARLPAPARPVREARRPRARDRRREELGLAAPACRSAASTSPATSSSTR